MISFEVENVKKGDIELFEQLFRQYYVHLVHFSYRYVKNQQVAEDTVHDVFFNIWNKRSELDFTLNFKSYLYTSVKNQSLKSLRKASKFEQFDLDVVFAKTESTPDNIMISKEFDREISKAISKLPEKRREIYCMHRFNNLSYSEIALTLNISIKTVETQMTRSLKFLRKHLAFLLK